MARSDLLSAQIAGVRRFTRGWTQVADLLERDYLHSGVSLPEARVLYELAQTESVRRRDLRARLGIDASFLTRVLSALADRSLLETRRSDVDKRGVDVTLTAAGRRLFGHLDSRASEQVATQLSRLSDEQRATALESMTVLERLFGTPRSEPARISVREPSPGDPGWVVARHGAVYADEFGWNIEFEALIARIVADFHSSGSPGGGERAWIAEVDGARAGCVYCCRRDEQTAQLRILLVEPWARGLGIGRRLVDECIAFARAEGYDRMVLWTNDILVAARHIYQDAGFTLVDENPHHSFGVDLVGQTWELQLRGSAG